MGVGGGVGMQVGGGGRCSSQDECPSETIYSSIISIRPFEQPLITSSITPPFPHWGGGAHFVLRHVLGLF